MEPSLFQSHLVERGWVVIDPEYYLREMCDGLEEFIGSWNRLASDPYVLDMSRRRRFGRFAFSDGRIRSLPHNAFMQSSAHNPLYGGMPRHFAQMEAPVESGAILSHILTCNAAVVSTELGGHLEIGVHQISTIQGLTGNCSLATPEGPHRDGFDFVAIQLIRTVNVAETGGVSVVWSAREEGPLSHRLAGVLECLLLDDRVCIHDTTPVRFTGADGRRDVLIQTFSAVRGFQEVPRG